MSFEEFFRDFWWLMFPVFGMFIAFMGMVQSESRSRKVMDLIKSYVDQGKEPPPELLKLAAQRSDYDMDMNGWTPPSTRNNSAWSFFMFAGLAAGFAVAYAFIGQTEDWAWVFLAVAVTMAVMAVGALILLITGAKR
jgi:Flp pilus assembly protein TadB